jgi:aspartate/methionine/tyrosine aminotransferase
MIWALSKDFGASGLRYGILYTQNELLIKALANINTMSCVSQPIQYMISEILTDDIFIDQYLYQSIHVTTQSCYDICCTKLNEMVIPYIKPDAAIYVYADFSSLLPSLLSFEAERQLTDLVRI